MLKCFVYLLLFQWKQGKWSLVDTTQSVPPIVIQQYENVGHMQLLAPVTTRKMLGVSMAPDGTSTGQLQELGLKADKWGEI